MVQTAGATVARPAESKNFLYASPFFNGSCLKLPGSVNLLYLISHTPTYSRPFPDENGSTMSVECTVVDDEIENVLSFLEVEFSALEFGST